MADASPPLFVYRHRVQFAETDMAGIMHFSNFFKMMESCEHAWFRSCGLTIHGQPTEAGQIGWPRVHASADYRAPLRFEEEVDIELRLAEKRRRVLRHAFTFRKPDEATVLATGEIVAVCATLGESGEIKAIEIPASILEKLGIA